MQGYVVKETVLHQDNLSTMLLEKNGKTSSSQRTKHIHLHYFYVKDKVAADEVKIKHCPTDMMLADFFTKPLQGTLFRKMRDQIMNIEASSVHHSLHRSVLEHENTVAAKLPEKEDVTRRDDDEGWILVKK